MSMVTSFFRLPRQMVVYLLQETMLFFVLTYLVLRSGTTIGLELNASYLFLIILIGGGWLAWRWIKKRPFPATGLDLALLIFLSSYIIPTIFSSDRRLSAEMILRILVYIIVFYVVVDLVRAGFPGELILKVIILTSLPVLFFGFLQLFFWYSNWLTVAGLGKWIPPVAQRVGVFLGHPNTLAAYLNLVLALSLYRVISTRSSISRSLLIVLVVLVQILLFFTSSRGGWLARWAILGTFCCGGVFCYRHKLLEIWSNSLTKIKFILSISVVLCAEVFISYLFFFWQSHSQSSAGVGLDPSARINIWDVASKIFRDHVFVGIGPFTFSGKYIEFHSVPPSMLLETAHNYLLNTAAENGLIGLIGLVVISIAIIMMIIRVWKKFSEANRVLLIGIVACLVSLSVHSLFDWVAIHPTISLFTAILLGILSAQDSVQDYFSNNRIGTLVFGVIWLIITVTMGWFIWAYYPVHQGVVSSNSSDWKDAAIYFDEAAARDPDLAINWFQAGFANGEIAIGSADSGNNKSELQIALSQYRKGLALEPSYSVNHINYGVLLWVYGDKRDAISEVQKGAQMAPNQLWFTLTWARMLEEDGQLDRAGEIYQRILGIKPEWEFSPFFRATAYRKNLISRLSTNNLSFRTQDAYSNITLNELRIGVFSGVIGGVPGNLELSRQYLRFGDINQAEVAYQNAISLLENTNSYGIGMMGYSPYANNYFRHESIATDLLPGVNTILYTDNILEQMTNLAIDFQIKGQSEFASLIEKTIYKNDAGMGLP